MQEKIFHKSLNLVYFFDHLLDSKKADYLYTLECTSAPANYTVWKAFLSAFQQYSFHGLKWSAWWVIEEWNRVFDQFWGSLCISLQELLGFESSKHCWEATCKYCSSPKKFEVIYFTLCVSVQQVLCSAFWWLCWLRVNCSSDSLQHRASTTKLVMYKLKEDNHSSL